MPKITQKKSRKGTSKEPSDCANKRVLTLKREPHVSKAGQSYEAIKAMVDQATSSMRQEIEELRSDIQTMTVVMFDISNNVELAHATCSTGSAKQQLEELLNNLSESISNVKHLSYYNTVVEDSIKHSSDANELHAEVGGVSTSTSLADAILRQRATIDSALIEAARARPTRLLGTSLPSYEFSYPPDDPTEDVLDEAVSREEEEPTPRRPRGGVVRGRGRGR